MPPNAGEISVIPFEVEGLTEKFMPNAESVYSWNGSTHADSPDTQDLNKRKVEDKVCRNEGTTKNCWDRDVVSQSKADIDFETKDNVDDYWEWSTSDDIIPTTSLPNEVNKDEFIKQILLEEELRKLLMVDNIEKQMTDESKMKREDIVEYECADGHHSADAERYWYWGKSSDNGNYEGEIRLDLKVGSIENRLVAESHRHLSSSSSSESHLIYNTTESTNYWEWEEDYKSDVIEVFPIDIFREERNKEELLKKILREEEIRRSLMVENTEINLGKDAKRRQEESKECESSMTDECNEYWSW